MQLSSQQDQAYSKIMHWYNSSEQCYALAGYAGTGKSTLADVISNEIGKDLTVFCAYTGKAAKVLKDKGCGTAGTLHSFLYQYLKNKEGKPVFTYSPTREIRQCRLIIVDEYSMLSDEILDHLIGTGKKILFLGDPFQLPPFTTNKKNIVPDFFLEEIHRQAEDSGILRAATQVRNGEGLDHCDWGDFIYKERKEIAIEDYKIADQIIVGRNNTRASFNDNFREHLGFKGVLQVGEKIICRKNNKELGLLNGMIGICTKNDNYNIDFKSDGAIFNNLPIWASNFNGSGHKYVYNKAIENFEHAYAITCHLSQGSEFNEIIVFNEAFGDEVQKRKWLYTAITRGKKKVTLVD